MRWTLTAEELRHAWHTVAGDTVRRPLQVLGPERTRAQARERARVLDHRWAAADDAALAAAVRLLAAPRAWVEALAFDADGRPSRALLALGPRGAALAEQEPVRGPGGAWSRETGGACRIVTGDAPALLAQLAAGPPRFTAAPGAPMRVPSAEPAGGGGAAAGHAAAGYARAGGYAGAATVTDAERIRRLLRAPGRRAEGRFVLATPAGGARAAVVWLVHAEGGHLVGGPGVLGTEAGGGALWARPAGAGELAGALDALAAGVPAHP